MPFIDEMYKKISTTGQEALKKARGFADVTSINVQLSKVNKELDAKYAELGKKTYALNPEMLPDEFSGLFADISSLLEQIQALNQQIQVLKNVRTCSVCGKQNDSESAFCVHCGAKMPELEVEQAATGNSLFCPSCGARLNSDSKFCLMCGQSLN